MSAQLPAVVPVVPRESHGGMPEAEVSLRKQKATMMKQSIWLSEIKQTNERPNPLDPGKGIVVIEQMPNNQRESEDGAAAFGGRSPSPEEEV